jgi:hypothetical protein
MKPRQRIEAALCGFFLLLPALIWLFKKVFR